MRPDPAPNQVAVLGAGIPLWRAVISRVENRMIFGRKSDVRLRFAQLGTDSWWFAIDNIAFYDDVSAPITAPVFNPITRSGNDITISWTGTGTLEESTVLGGTWTQSPSQNNPQTVTVSTTGNKFYRLKQ